MPEVSNEIVVTHTATTSTPKRSAPIDSEILSKRSKRVESLDETTEDTNTAQNSSSVLSCRVKDNLQQIWKDFQSVHTELETLKEENKHIALQLADEKTKTRILISSNQELVISMDKKLATFKADKDRAVKNLETEKKKVESLEHSHAKDIEEKVAEVTKERDDAVSQLDQLRLALKAEKEKVKSLEHSHAKDIEEKVAEVTKERDDALSQLEKLRSDLESFFKR